MSEHEFHPLVPWVDDNAQGLRFYTQGQRIVGKPWGECEELSAEFHRYATEGDVAGDLSPYRLVAVRHAELLRIQANERGTEENNPVAGLPLGDSLPGDERVPFEPLPKSPDDSDAFDNPGTTLIEPV